MKVDTCWRSTVVFQVREPTDWPDVGEPANPPGTDRGIGIGSRYAVTSTNRIGSPGFMKYGNNVCKISLVPPVFPRTSRIRPVVVRNFSIQFSSSDLASSVM